MAAAFIIVLREVIEAGLIVGIVLAASRGVPGRGGWIAGGAAAGVVGAGIVALFASSIAAAFAGSGQELFNVAVLLLAIVMLTWHNVWMARHSAAITAELKAVGAAVAAGERPLAALATVVGLAALREGSEVVLFLYGIAMSGEESRGSMAVGGLLGVAGGATLAVLIYLGLLRIPTQYIFSVTSCLIALLSAGMAAQAAMFLHQADLVTAWAQPLWDTSAILADDSIVGRVLHTLIGYADRPTGFQAVAYAMTLVVMYLLMAVVGSGGRRRAVA